MYEKMINAGIEYIHDQCVIDYVDYDQKDTIGIGCNLDLNMTERLKDCLWEI